MMQFNPEFLALHFIAEQTNQHLGFGDVQLYITRKDVKGKPSKLYVSLDRDLSFEGAPLSALERALTICRRKNLPPSTVNSAAFLLVVEKMLENHENFLQEREQVLAKTKQIAQKLIEQLNNQAIAVTPAMRSGKIWKFLLNSAAASPIHFPLVGVNSPEDLKLSLILQPHPFHVNCWLLKLRCVEGSIQLRHYIAESYPALTDAVSSVLNIRFTQDTAGTEFIY